MFSFLASSPTLCFPLLSVSPFPSYRTAASACPGPQRFVTPPHLDLPLLHCSLSLSVLLPRALRITLYPFTALTATVPQIVTYLYPHFFFLFFVCFTLFLFFLFLPFSNFYLIDFFSIYYLCFFLLYFTGLFAFLFSFQIVSVYLSKNSLYYLFFLYLFILYFFPLQFPPLPPPTPRLSSLPCYFYSSSFNTFLWYIVLLFLLSFSFHTSLCLIFTSLSFSFISSSSSSFRLPFQLHFLFDSSFCQDESP